MRLALKETRAAIYNSTTRLPFRYAGACMTCCPQLVLRVVVEIDGKRQAGHSGDCLPPGWFDKTPGKPYRRQVDEMLSVIQRSQNCFAEHFQRPAKFFPTWHAAHRQIQAEVAGQLPPLLASFGVSLVERAIMDAVARAREVSFHTACQNNLLGIDPGLVYDELRGLQPRQWLLESPRPSIYVRHTVGLGDPLTASDVAHGDDPADGFPFTLEQYLASAGLRYFKIKLSSHHDHDLYRLQTIAELLARYRGADYRVTLDGNEQYGTIDELRPLVHALQEISALRPLLANTLAIEQPLNRSVALSSDHGEGIRALSELVPVIIDESDGCLDSFRRAIDLGYRGVTSKSCKGVIKAILNAGLVWFYNERGANEDYLMTGEDLCCVGVVPVQTDLCLAATLGLEHVERNGHHYHPGLSYLPDDQQRAALLAHPDFYHEHQGRIAPRVQDGQFQIGSMQCPGLGFAAEPDLDSMQAADQWSFETLGIPE